MKRRLLGLIVGLAAAFTGTVGRAEENPPLICITIEPNCGCRNTNAQYTLVEEGCPLSGGRVAGGRTGPRLFLVRPTETGHGTSTYDQREVTVDLGAVPELMGGLIAANQAIGKLSDSMETELRKIEERVTSHIAAIEKRITEDNASLSVRVDTIEKDTKADIGAVEAISAALPPPISVPPVADTDSPLGVPSRLAEAQREVVTSEPVESGRILPDGPDIAGLLAATRAQKYQSNERLVTSRVKFERDRLRDAQEMDLTARSKAKGLLDKAERFSARGGTEQASALLLAAKAQRYTSEGRLRSAPNVYYDPRNGTYTVRDAPVGNDEYDFAASVDKFEGSVAGYSQQLVRSQMIHGPAPDQVFDFHVRANAFYLQWVSDKYFGGDAGKAEYFINYFAGTSLAALDNVAGAFAELQGRPPSDKEAQAAYQLSKVCSTIASVGRNPEMGDSCNKAYLNVAKYINAGSADRAALTDAIRSQGDVVRSQYHLYFEKRGEGMGERIQDKWRNIGRKLRNDQETRRAFIGYLNASRREAIASAAVEENRDYVPPTDPIKDYLSSMIGDKIISKMIERFPRTRREKREWELSELLQDSNSLIDALSSLDAGQPHYDALARQAEARLDLWQADQELRRLLDPETYELLTTPTPQGSEDLLPPPPYVGSEYRMP